MNKSKNCKYCKKEIDRKIHPRSEFCHYRCKNAFNHKRNVGKRAYTKRRSDNVKRLYHNSEEYRLKAIRRAIDRKLVEKGKCDICGIKDNLQIHHISYEPSKFIVVCVKCHTEIHYGN